MKNNRLKARLLAIRSYLPDLRSQKTPESERIIRFLRQGFIPESVASTLDSKIELYQQNYSEDTLLTDKELCSLDTYFTKYPELIAGKQIEHSSRDFPVRVVGTPADVRNAFGAAIDHLRTVAKEPLQPNSIPTQEPAIEPAPAIEPVTDETPTMEGPKFIPGSRYQEKQTVTGFQDKIYITKVYEFEGKYYYDWNYPGQINSSLSDTEEHIASILEGATLLHEGHGEVIHLKETDFIYNPGAEFKHSVKFYQKLTIVRVFRQNGFNWYEIDEQAKMSKEIFREDKLDEFLGDWLQINKGTKEKPKTEASQEPAPKPAQEPGASQEKAKSKKKVSDYLIQEVEIPTNALTSLEGKIDAGNSQGEAAQNPLLSFDEVIEVYNQGITRAEIEAWVWYKRQFNIPMTGWERYFISNAKSGNKGVVLYSKATITLKDNAFRDVRTVPAGVVLGKQTKFAGLEYHGVFYIIVRNEDGELFYVDKGKTVERKQDFFVLESKLEELAKANALAYIQGEYMPIPVFTFGNMYEREEALLKEREDIIEKFGIEYYGFLFSLIQNAKPKFLTVENKDKAMRPKISVMSSIAMDVDWFSIVELADETGIVLPKPKSQRVAIDTTTDRYSLHEGFEEWLDTVKDSDIENSNKRQIVQYYLNGDSDDDADGNIGEIRATARVAAEKLFSEFLATGLLPEDQKLLNEKWNATYNAYSAVNKFKVPVGFTCSRTFKDSLLEIRPVQREGVGFMGIVGSGCLAYDVGVGKTLVAIIVLAQAIQSGECKRPLLVVPKPTYAKWKRELFGYWTDGERKKDFQFPNSRFVAGIISGTGITLNDWQNLGTDVKKRLGAKTLQEIVPENSITMVTYEGLDRIGFSNKTFKSIFAELVEILENGGDVKRAQRDAIKAQLKWKQMMSIGVKDTICDIDTLGFDYLCVDEAHNFKNVFESVGKDDKDKRKSLFGIKGSQSDRGVKLFFLSNHIQRNFGRKVCLLTATPFTNSPLEIFSMFSFIGYEQLRKYNLQNIRRFFETFVLETIDYVVNKNEDIVAKNVIKSYNNKLILQRLLYNCFDYKTGEDAGVVRPCKIDLPMLKGPDGRELLPEDQITTYLEMTEWQKSNQKQILNSARNAAFGDKDAVSVFELLSMSLNNALSPYLYQSTIPSAYLTCEEFVENSPKIHYTMRCIKSVKEYHEARGEKVSGQVIYCNRGKDYFPLMKQYLEDVIGYKKKVRFGDVWMDEVEIITSKTTADRKENIKEAFLANVVKVIIGTATIEEGIDLQTNGTVLYNLLPHWNPTSIKQLAGRIWRQGNNYGFVRIVMPLLKDSMDIFVFQKLEEKTARLNDIWFRADGANVLELSSIDVQEIKFALIDDPAVLARFQVEQDKLKAKKQVDLANENIQLYKGLQETLAEYNQLRKDVETHLNAALPELKGLIHDVEFGIKSLKPAGEKLSADEKNKINRGKAFIDKCKRVVTRIENYFTAVVREDKELLDMAREFDNATWRTDFYSNHWIYYLVPGKLSDYKKVLGWVSRFERYVLFARGLTIYSDLSVLSTELYKDRDDKVQALADVSKSSYFDNILEKIARELQKRAAVNGDLESQVAKFIKTNMVLSYKADNVDRKHCFIPDEPCCLLPAKPVMQLTSGTDKEVEVEYVNTEDVEAPAVEFVQPEVIEVPRPKPTLDSYQATLEGLELLYEDTTDSKQREDIEATMEGIKLLIEDMQEELSQAA